jgi:hypothetical protein
LNEPKDIIVSPELKGAILARVWSSMTRVTGPFPSSTLEVACFPYLVNSFEYSGVKYIGKIIEGFEDTRGTSIESWRVF